MNPYETLNVKKSAGEAAINGAYRALSKVYHPDMPDGNAEKFGELRRARDVLLNPELRAQYDASGVMPDSEDALILQQARTMLSEVFCAVVAQNSPAQLERTDIIKELRNHFNAAAEKMHGDIASLQQQADRLLKTKAMIERRLKKKKDQGGDNIFIATMDKLHADLLAEAAGGGERLKLLAKVQELLDEYRFEVSLADVMPRFVRFDTSVSA